MITFWGVKMCPGSFFLGTFFDAIFLYIWFSHDMMTTKTWIVVGIATLFLMGGGLSFASARHPAVTQAGFESSPAFQKLDLRARQAWQEWRTQGGASGQSFECMLKASHPLTEDDKRLLAAAGFRPRTVVGAIVTGSVAPERVPEVASLSWVTVMELAVPMSLKK